MSITAGVISIVEGIGGNGEMVILLGIFGTDPKLITLGILIGGTIFITLGICIGPNGPISRQGNTIGGSCISAFTRVPILKSISGIVGRSGKTVSRFTGKT